jgi:hypothetical protein
MRIDDLFKHSWELDALVFLYRKQFQLHKMSGVDSGEQSYFAQCGEQGAEQEGRSLVHRGCYWVKMFATALAPSPTPNPAIPATPPDEESWVRGQEAFAMTRNR